MLKKGEVIAAEIARRGRWTARHILTEERRRAKTDWEQWRSVEVSSRSDSRSAKYPLINKYS